MDNRGSTLERQASGVVQDVQKAAQAGIGGLPTPELHHASVSLHLPPTAACGILVCKPLQGQNARRCWQSISSSGEPLEERVFRC